MQRNPQLSDFCCTHYRYKQVARCKGGLFTNFVEKGILRSSVALVAALTLLSVLLKHVTYFLYQIQECHCYDGWHYIGVEEDGEEHVEAVRCRWCSLQTLSS